MATVNPIPAGYHTVTPYLIVKECAQALEFYKKALNATELFRMDGPNGTIMHAEMKIGNSHVMIADEMLDWGAKGPETLGGSPVSMCLYVEDVDRLFTQATAAGGTIERPVTNQFWGDRAGTFKDPFGHKWTIMTHVEDVSDEEMKKRMAKMKADG